MLQHILGQPFRISEIPPLLPEDPLNQTPKCRLKLQVCERILMFFSSLLVNAVHENFDVKILMEWNTSIEFYDDFYFLLRVKVLVSYLSFCCWLNKMGVGLGG